MHVLMTGAEGTIGTVLRQGLQADTTSFDLPEHDARDLDQLARAAKGHDAVIHLAWNVATENMRSESVDPDNGLMAANAYRAALLAGVPRIIIASSVQADIFPQPKLIRADAVGTPQNVYGADKVFIEALGRHYATKGLGVICIRFGGVRVDNIPSTETPTERQVWLHNTDCVSLVQTCLEASTVPDNFAVLHGVSDNPGRLHDLSNPFGWWPRHGSL